MTESMYAPGKITSTRFYVVMCSSCYNVHFMHVGTLVIAESQLLIRGWWKSQHNNWLCGQCTRERE